MNISQSQLTQIEQDLIRLVLNFHFDLGRSSICFNNINSQIDLAPIKTAEYYTETFDVNLLNDIRQRLESQLTVVKSEYDSLREKLSELYGTLSDEEKSWESDEEAYAHAPIEFKKMRDEVNRLESYLGKLYSTLLSITDAISADGIVQTSLLGSFRSEEMRIYLYLENIIQAANGKKREYILITTFIHEMFHAWNYIACGKKDRTIREIDEAMVEFATLFFLKQITKVHSEFEPIFEWAKHDISRKQTAIGSIAAYGYGYYLYSHVGYKEEKNVMAMLEAYSSMSGNITNSNLVKQVIGMLCSCYPFGKERDVFTLIYQILFPGVKTRIMISQKQQVIDALRKLGGSAKLQDLYKIIDTSTWHAQKPDASIRRTLQSNKEFFMIRPGIWGLEEYRNEIEKQIMQGNI